MPGNFVLWGCNGGWIFLCLWREGLKNNETSAHTFDECFYFQGQLNVFSAKTNALFIKRCTVKCFHKIILSQSWGQQLKKVFFPLHTARKLGWEQLWDCTTDASFTQWLSISVFVIERPRGSLKNDCLPGKLFFLNSSIY